MQEHQRPLPQLFRICNGISIVLDQVAPAIPQGPPASERALREIPPTNIQEAQDTAQNHVQTVQLPAWLTFDRQVLRFFAYVKEPLLEVAPEAYRVRHCIMLHHLEDATLAINEPRQPGSSFPCGPVLKRHKFMEAQRTPLDADIPAPEDPQEQRERERRAAGLKTAAQRPQPVLRFQCYWDDRLALYGDMRMLRLYYYLSDDTVHLVEVLRPNCGRDPFPHMLRRMRLPKHPEPVGARPLSEGLRITPPEAYYRWQELRIGGQIEVFGRKVMIYDCDAFTRQWIKEHLQLPDAALKPMPPKPPRKDFNKFVGNDGKVLRFSAVLNPRPGSSPADAAIDLERSFVVSFFLADNALLIFERAQPNSGWVGGKYLERRQIRNPAASSFYGPQDMRVGAKVHAAGRTFSLTAADEYTRKYLESTIANRDRTSS
ncbi:hypothetical protein COCSUDRAFT_67526 [Coccomyxa subellipsoidea C-169]|uniref:DM10 domain-containing protein n=1 Tax=Coccomyxa subellipsoidea (strain C-169) TaxID=574566 RepID=I0YP77_COCSC|nr:hypothetical protein COCSUDRAFT_67526 [Coccomyxa subellipsoidea C-169]EIE20196.1 hypothetical protein COCSUDRAFT_67526 [Coccomyxa subellipsoidea C-169]|eukprot:XP_005644740.1 hypothetical protein COCSUDRAFT_67526 [Coccomyxa subellipsoidea C-169]